MHCAGSAPRASSGAELESWGQHMLGTPLYRVLPDFVRDGEELLGARLLCQGIGDAEGRESVEIRYPYFICKAPLSINLERRSSTR